MEQREKEGTSEKIVMHNYLLCANYCGGWWENQNDWPQILTQKGLYKHKRFYYYHHRPQGNANRGKPKCNTESSAEYLISINGDYYKGRILESFVACIFSLYSLFLISLMLVCVCSSVSMGSSYWQNKPGVNYGRIEIDSTLKHWSAQFTSGRASVFTETWLSSAPRVIRCVIQ